MNNSSMSLASSLVGGSIDFSFRNKVSNVTAIDENIAVEKNRIARNVKMAFEAGGETCVILLGEMTSSYMKEIYYMAVRSAIEMRRYRPLVLEYLQLSVDERADKLAHLLSTKKGRIDKERDAKIEALRYFLRTYTGRIKYFKPLITREEFLIIS